MGTSHSSGGDKVKAASPTYRIRSVLDTCADCDTCRFIMDECCLFFPELYRLYDREKETGRKTGDRELAALASLCTLCGLCPCYNIRADILLGKAELLEHSGMSLAARILADVQSLGRICGLFPDLVNNSLGLAPFRRVLGRVVGIHPARRIPAFPPENFFSWVRKQGLGDPPRKKEGVAYFAGCTAGYIFPEVARAVVLIFQKNGVPVYVPPQRCCGMPSLIEGDTGTAVRRLSFNLRILIEAIDLGLRPVFSCPTCGYVMKVLLKEGAFYSEAYQRRAGAVPGEIKVPEKRGGPDGHTSLSKMVYGEIFKDDGIFSGLDPLQRIALADAATDVGVHLERLRAEGRLVSDFRPVPMKVVHFTSCHQREQGTGDAYKNMLALIPGLVISEVGGSMDCCGMGGSLGFKNDFHDDSLRLGTPLFQKIRAHEPDAIVTDCLSCRVQFNQAVPYPVYHPLEIIARAYESDTPEGRHTNI